MAKKKAAPGLVEQLIDAIRDSGQSLNQLSKVSGVDSGRLSRFVRGERNISLEAAAKLCRALNLQLAPTGQRPSAKSTGPKQGGLE
jgi:transcriptional regulator with XRE-family HTH domain